MSLILCGLVTDPPPGDGLFSKDGKCPKCGTEIMRGYGLFGGGMGLYETCDSETCDYFVKHQDKDGEW